VISDLLKLLGVSKLSTSSYHPGRYREYVSMIVRMNVCPSGVSGSGPARSHAMNSPNLFLVGTTSASPLLFQYIIVVGQAIPWLVNILCGDLPVFLLLTNHRV
jgi:hypothetical protein